MSITYTAVVKCNYETNTAWDFLVAWRNVADKVIVENTVNVDKCFLISNDGKCNAISDAWEEKSTLPINRSLLTLRFNQVYAAFIISCEDPLMSSTPSSWCQSNEFWQFWETFLFLFLNQELTHDNSIDSSSRISHSVSETLWKTWQLEEHSKWNGYHDNTNLINKKAAKLLKFIIKKRTTTSDPLWRRLQHASWRAPPIGYPQSRTLIDKKVTWILKSVTIPATLIVGQY